jgi:hypothetical protein
MMNKTSKQKGLKPLFCFNPLSLLVPEVGIEPT